MPVRFVIGQDGTIVYAEVSARHTPRTDPRSCCRCWIGSRPRSEMGEEHSLRGFCFYISPTR
jgi:hypothetical protein